MPYSKKLVADAVIAALTEGLGIYNLCNRSYDGLVKEDASSVDIPALPDLVVKTAGSAGDSADRKGVKGDTSMVNVPLDKASVPIKDEILAQFETNGKLLKDFISGANNSFIQHFDTKVLETAVATDQVLQWKGATLAWKDITALNKKFNTNKVPRKGRIIVIPSALEDEFYDIDVVKQAVAYNRDLLENGIVKVQGMTFFVSGLLPQVGGKDAIVGIYGPGLAFILSRFCELKQAWDGVNLQDNIDVLSHFGYKLLNTKFAVVNAAA
jgi:hypothetical protein